MLSLVCQLDGENACIGSELVWSVLKDWDGLGVFHGLCSFCSHHKADRSLSSEIQRKTHTKK